MSARRTRLTPSNASASPPATEYISPYVNSCLYSLVNTRVCRRLPTIYTSNIVNDADLQRRYTEKVVSRLLGSCETLCFCGTDIRLMDK